jgi:hypothetical protein
MSEGDERAMAAQAAQGISGFLWVFYAFSGVGTGLALASFGSAWWLSVLGGLAWPAELLYWIIQALRHAAGA